MPDSNEILPSKQFDQLSTKQIIGYKASAFDDYIAARVLFNVGCLQQACLFANTCIEKELKAFLLYHNKKSTSHDTFNLYNQMLRYDPEMRSTINRDFIEVISKVYRSRYHEDLKPGYNYVICQNKFLAELDHTYNELEYKTFIDYKMMPNPDKSLYEREIDTKNPALFENNYILNKINKSDFLARNDFVNEFRLHRSHIVFQARYTISHNPDQDFKHEALKILDVIYDDIPSVTLEIFYKSISSEVGYRGLS